MRIATIRTAVATAAATALLAGCGSTETESETQEPAPTEASSTAPSGPAEYGSVEDLRDAAVAVGFECPKWKQTNAVTLAAESGTCSSDSVLTTYASEADLQAQLDQEKENATLMTDVGLSTEPILVGPNWLVKSPDAPDLREGLGGVVIGAKS